jgi:phospholipid transport system transporter-binding protein
MTAEAVPATQQAFRIRPADGRLLLEGELTFASARRAMELGIQVLTAAPPGELVMDCGSISACDSAGLAVLLEWLGFARRTGRKLRCTQLPPGLAALARISEVEKLLSAGV